LEATVSADPVKQVSLLDGIANLTTGLGTSKDKSMSNQWDHSGRNTDHVGLSVRFREDWISQKVCKIIPQDMTREWRSFKDDDAQEADESFDVDLLFKLAYQWARLYGTSFIVLDIDDKRSPEKPVNWDKLQKGCLRSMHVVDRTRIVATGQIDQDPMSVTYGMPNTYQFVGMTTPIHKDRLVRFEGTELPIYERMRNLWYSDSILIPLMDLIDSFHTTAHAASQMVQEANIDVIKVEGLSNILQNSKGTSAMIQRFSEWKQIKSVFGVSILDGSEEYDQKNMQLSGVKDMLWEYLRIVSASVGIPATRFLCASPDGLNATGQSDQVNYVDLLIGLQNEIFKPRLRVIDKLLSAHYGIDLEKFKYEFNCIFPESSKDQTERLDILTDSLTKLTTAGILSTQSALDEAKRAGLVHEEATLGTLPTTTGDSK